MKIVCIFVVLAAAILAFFFVASSSEDKERREWRDFVAQHHCSVVPTKWYEATRWQCDGFQVEHP